MGVRSTVTCHIHMHVAGLLHSRTAHTRDHIITTVTSNISVELEVKLGYHCTCTASPASPLHTCRLKQHFKSELHKATERTFIQNAYNQVNIHMEIARCAVSTLEARQLSPWWHRRQHRALGNLSSQCEKKNRKRRVLHHCPMSFPRC